MQREAFAAHIALAKAYDKTLVVHDRDAHADILDVLDSEGLPDRVVMHCFSGDDRRSPEPAWTAAPTSPLPAPSPSRPNDQLRAALAVAPLDRVLVETDAPYLTPMPLRGRPNASYLIPHTARFLAATLGIGLERVVPGAQRQRRCRLRRELVAMDFADVLRRRRMIRAYEEARPVPADALDAVLAAALRAPSAGFTQGVSLLVLSSAPERETFWQAAADARQPWLAGMRTAPVAGPGLDQPGGLPRPLRRAGQGLDRPRSGAMVRALLVRRRRDGDAWPCCCPRSTAISVPASSASRADRIAAVREAFGVPANQLSVGVISLGYPAPAPAIGSPTRRPTVTASRQSSFTAAPGDTSSGQVSDLGRHRRVVRYNFVTHPG